MYLLRDEDKRAKIWETLLYAATAHKDISELIAAAAQLFDNPVVLADKSTKLIARSAHDISDSVLWNDHTQHGYFTSETMQSSNYKRLSRSLDQGVVYLQKQISKYNTLNKTVTVDNIAIGTISVLDVNRPFLPEDTTILERLTQILSYYFDRDNSYQFVQDAKRESFFLSLLKEPITDTGILAKRAGSLGIREDLVYCVAVAVNQAWSGETDLVESCENLTKFLPRCYTFIYNDCVLAVIPEGKSEVPWYDSEPLQKYLKAQNMTIGISRQTHGLANICEQYWEAAMAQYTGRKLGGGQSVFHFEQLALHSLFLSASANVELRDFCSIPLARLTQFDAENNTAYVETLRTYIQCNANVTRSAESLYIHRSTLIYRLKKIEEIIGLSLESDRFRNHLYLSFLITELQTM